MLFLIKFFIIKSLIKYLVILVYCKKIKSQFTEEKPNSILFDWLFRSAEKTSQYQLLIYNNLSLTELKCKIDLNSIGFDPTSFDF